MVFPAVKIRPPRLRAGALLDRPALEARLATALADAACVLLCAPAGCGKTVLLARGLEQLPADTARVWVALDEGDTLRVLIEALLLALEPHDLPWRQAPEALLDLCARPEALPDLAALLADALDACGVAHGVIALDDVQHLRDDAALRFLDLLLHRLPAHWTLALAARQQPALRLAGLRGRGALVVFDEAALRFAEAESCALLAGAGWPPEPARQLHARTAGWPAGLRLALSGAQAEGTAIDRAAFDLLSSEVLDGLEPGLRRFLLDTSVLHELDPARCAAVSGEAQPLRWLDAIVRHGLFVVVIDEAQPTLRLHDLFRDALRHRLRLERPQDEPRLLRHAAALALDPVRRQALLLQAGAHEAAAEALFEAAAQIATERGGNETLRQLCSRFPPDMAARSPEIHHVQGMLRWALWDTRQAEHHFARAEALFMERGDELNAFRSRAQRAITQIGLGRLSDAGALIDSLAAQAPADEPLQATLALARTWWALESCRFDEVTPAFALLVQRLEQRLELRHWFSTVPPPRQTLCPGIAPWIARWAEGALAILGDQPLPLRALALLSQAWLQLWQGRRQAARALLERAEDDARWTGHQLITRNHALAMHSTLAAFDDDRPRLRVLIDERLATLPPSYGDWGVWHLLFMCARLAARCNDAALLADLLARLEALGTVLVDLQPRRLQPLWGLRGNLAWLHGQHAQAEQHWRSGLADPAAFDLYGQVAETRLRRLRWRLQHEAAAACADELAELLQQPQPGGLLFAQDVLRELAGLAWGSALPAPLQARLHEWAGTRATAGAPADGPGSASLPDSTTADAAEPVTGREREVLALIARGASNKLIARELDLSPHTVKRHVANILTKLDLASRAQAAAWWQARAMP